MPRERGIEILIMTARWNRWLGQKCRRDKAYWSTLLNCNWLGWAGDVLDAHEAPACHKLKMHTREMVKEHFRRAILFANVKDFQRLDNLYATEKAGL